MSEKQSVAQQFGAQAEQLAAQHYLAQGFVLEQMNYRTRQGEIDVIVRKKDLLVFAEVKARACNSIAAPREFVTLAKQRKIIAAATAYLAATHSSDSFVRFDVVEVQRSGTETTLCCLENAFDAQ